MEESLRRPFLASFGRSRGPRGVLETRAGAAYFYRIFQPSFQFKGQLKDSWLRVSISNNKASKANKESTHYTLLFEVDALLFGVDVLETTPLSSQRAGSLFGNGYDIECSLEWSSVFMYYTVMSFSII